ncbi:hypothetical protein Droror1_Dr00019220 [Drosera rotundifolia]
MNCGINSWKCCPCPMNKQDKKFGESYRVSYAYDHKDSMSGSYQPNIVRGPARRRTSGTVPSSWMGTDENHPSPELASGGPHQLDPLMEAKGQGVKPSTAMTGILNHLYQKFKLNRKDVPSVCVS